jgi:hypothetical protein
MSHPRLPLFGVPTARDGCHEVFVEARSSKIRRFYYLEKRLCDVVGEGGGRTVAFRKPAKSGRSEHYSAHQVPSPQHRSGKMRVHLKLWRRVRGTKSLKSVPSYFQLARQRRLNTAWITSPLNRCCLKLLSKRSNLLARNVCRWSVVLASLRRLAERERERDLSLLPTYSRH